jgi:hypothetical protein
MFIFKYWVSEKQGSPYFQALNNRYEEEVYEEFQLLIQVIFVELPRIIFQVLNFEFIIS